MLLWDKLPQFQLSPPVFMHIILPATMSVCPVDYVVPVLAFAGTVAAVLLKQGTSRAPKKTEEVTISQLWIYPIKSCRGIRVSKAEVTPRGFALDRIFMVVDSKGKFVSQRTHSNLALVEVAIAEQDGVAVLKVNAPGMKTLVVPVAYPTNTAELEVLAVDVWGDECQGIEVLGKEGSTWFETYLNVPGVRFVRMKDDCVRKTDAKYAPAGQTSFSDGFPFLLASEASLDHVNANISEPITHARFRANIILQGTEPFVEDTWEKVRFHGVQYLNTSDAQKTTVDMSVVKPCARCTMPNIDPDTAVPHPTREPSRSMQAFRSGSAIGLKNEKWGKQLFYGQNLDHEGQSGMVLSEASKVQVLAAGAPFMKK